MALLIFLISSHIRRIDPILNNQPEIYEYVNLIRNPKEHRPLVNDTHKYTLLRTDWIHKKIQRSQIQSKHAEMP